MRLMDIQNRIANEEHGLGTRPVSTGGVVSVVRTLALRSNGPRTIIPDVLGMSAIRSVPVKQKAGCNPYKRNSPIDRARVAFEWFDHSE
ncbi:hypothetical protein GCM10023155_06750 [Bremerella cremea]